MHWPQLPREHKPTFILGSGGGSVGRAVTFDSRDPRFESQHRQSFNYQLLLNRKDKNNEKEAGNGPSLKKISSSLKTQLVISMPSR